MPNYKKEYRIVIAFFKYLKFKLIKSRKAFLPGISSAIYVRPNTSDVSTFRQIFVHKGYDIQLDFNPKTIIDAGANIGLAAVYFADRYPDATIISIEPEKSNYHLLEKNTADYKSLIGINKALSNIPNQVINIVDKGLGKWGFVTEFNDTGQKDNVIDTIKTTSIDEIMNENSIEIIDILKIDIEGAEKNLFESNFEQWLPKTRCLIIELHDGMNKGASKVFFKAISNYDFSYFQRGENLVFINND